ncbi:HAD family hydrolase [Sulfitobacter donghicola]|uniref:HAD hydrolase n=1 Tax=Sulfitobacter donghicola DSW-25 = KCTC 12864 = JCM 14565 TaxID=1300350 RepID=A0A073IZW4_9RHOB|nr:HAD family hydrolase [Sulfitobacter donghicola]KEJ90942.1 HAD hydrolase [Sulfitobacter donghicola DSW-25 = KCTC 12864 = JCM 14565]KIN68232.1 HAD superfamily hydrolase [Sulfitobacter donghicola DSW-25 = KCTC 12864 = JCM 14565]
MTSILTTIGFDADDTLWHNERFFALTQDHFADLLADFTERETLMARLLDAERRNLPHYGFGIKGFTLSMIETAIEVTDGRVPAAVITQLLDAGRDMLSHPVELLPHAADTIDALRHSHKVLVVTKGDLLDQERKLAQSGLRDLFDGIEIVSAKTADTYTRIFNQHGTGPDQGLMIGNSMASDVIPMIQAGGWGVYVPHGLTWAIEHATAPDHPKFHEIKDLGALPDLLQSL